MTRRPFVAAVSAASAALASFFYAEGFSGVIYDSYHYFVLSRIVSAEGIWNLASRVRTYGYPLFISLATGFSEVSVGTARLLVFASQLLLFLVAAWLCARIAERVFGSPRYFFGTFLALALNPFALLRATEMLSDLLAAVLVLLAVFFYLEPSRRPAPRAFGVFLLAGLAAAVRPAAIAVLPALAAVSLIRDRFYRETWLPVFAAAALGTAVALLPQAYLNGAAYGAWTPLPVERIYAEQVRWGMAILKYGTRVSSDGPPGIVYRNPYLPEGVSSPREFLEKRPLGYLATLAVHGFALFDQDFPFTYVTGPPPAYRWPLALANYAYLFLAAAGLALGLRAAPRRSPMKLYFVSAAIGSAALVALYLPVAVESRFSLPVILILAPAAVFACLWLAGRRSGTVVAVAIAGGGFVAACVQISRWLAAQAPGLH